jgi:hypothetical protein
MKILDIMGLKCRFVFNLNPLWMHPPWSPTIHYPVLSNIDEMSILATLQGKPVHSSARKGKNQNEETSGFKSPSYPR